MHLLQVLICILFITNGLRIKGGKNISFLFLKRVSIYLNKLNYINNTNEQLFFRRF